MVREGPEGPHVFLHDDVDTSPHWADMAGLYTRYGDVRELLASADDRYVVLKSGDAVLCMAWSADIYQATPDKPSLAYNLPDEGGMLWTDNMMIPKGAAHKGTAELLINYYYDPAVNAEITHATDYLSPCKGADEVLLQKYPDDAKNPLIVPPADWVARFHIFGALSSDDETYFNKQFAKVMGVG